MFNGSKIEEIRNHVFEVNETTKELARRMSKSNLNRLENIVAQEKNLKTIEQRLRNLEESTTAIEQALLAIMEHQVQSVKNQVQILKNQQAFIKPKERKKRSKPLTSASGWKFVSEDEKIMFVEMYDSGKAIVDIANATGRTSSTVTRWVNKTLKERDETAKTKSK